MPGYNTAWHQHNHWEVAFYVELRLSEVGPRFNGITSAEAQRATASSSYGGRKLRTLIYIYEGAYLLFLVWTILDDVKEKEPWWDVASDVILLPLGGIGIFLFLFDVSDPSIKVAWKAISILIVAGQIIENVISRHLTLAGKTVLRPEEISQWRILMSDLTTIILLAPMFALNLIFAFS